MRRKVQIHPKPLRESYASGSDAPRKFSEARAERMQLGSAVDPDWTPDDDGVVHLDPLELEPQQRADAGPHPLSKPVIFRKLR